MFVLFESMLIVLWRQGSYPLYQKKRLENRKNKKHVKTRKSGKSIPIASMYGIFTYIYYILLLKTTKCR